MKKKIAAIIAACAALVFAAGCNTKTYEIYTNIPADGYTVTSRKFKLSQFIDGSAENPATLSASDTSDYTTKRVYYETIMNSDAILYISADFNEQTTQTFNALKAEIYDTLTSINNSLSVTVEGSCIYDFNEADAGAEVEIDKTAYDVLRLAQSIYGQADGYYNPAVYYSVQAYGFDGNYNYPKNAAELPKAEDIEKFVELSKSFGDIVLDEREGKYYATKPEAVDGLALKIDLGGIGKGYAADEVNKLIEAKGFEYGYFSFAQSSVAFKKFFNDDHNYILQLKNPRERGNTFMNIPVSDVCVSTSGDYEQSYFIGGTRYCHIINPMTGKPVQTGIMSATVIGESAAACDALSTAIMAMGKDAAIKFIKDTLNDYRVIFTYDKSAEVESVA